MRFDLDRRTLLRTGAGGLLLAGTSRRALAQKRAKVLRAVMHTALRANDPIVTSSWSTRNHGYNVYDTLFAEDSKFTVRPQMAEGHEVSADKLTYTFVLRPGLKFHDGSPVTSADVIASLKRWGQRDAMGQLLMSVAAEWVPVDERTVRERGESDRRRGRRGRRDRRDAEADSQSFGASITPGPDLGEVDGIPIPPRPIPSRLVPAG